MKIKIVFSSNVAVKRTLYIDTLGNPQSNAAIARFLSGDASEYECEDQLCKDRIRRPLWECPINTDLLSLFAEWANNEKISYAIYIKKGPDELIELEHVMNADKDELKQDRKQNKVRKKRIKKLSFGHS